MRVQGLIFAGTAVFMVTIGAIYWFTSYEPAGTVMLGLCIGLGVIPGVALLWWSRRSPVLPEDRADAVPDDGAGRIGSFPESSAWPIVLAAGAAMTAAGLVFGVWAAIPGMVLVLLAFVGGALESRSQH